MTESKVSPGRPKYTVAQRKFASDQSFVRALMQAGDKGCMISRRKHITGYDGRQTRIRTFAWGYWNPETPIDTVRVVNSCDTPGCVAKTHLVGIAKIDGGVKEATGATNGTEVLDAVKEADVAEYQRDTYEKLLKKLKGKEKQGETLTSRDTDPIMNLWFTRPLPESHPECEVRINFIDEYITKDYDEYMRIAADWGIITGG